ncbi:STAS domain-containing protein [Cellulomonas endophytica]|uniref:STAS domain-containing protein n=1 Tax=Cellulomonas endophytica TaxID=2494735 RepID=UPI0010117A00|nr:STAS domain-containing protein [Cellulomonas endophytica]
MARNTPAADDDARTPPAAPATDGPPGGPAPSGPAARPDPAGGAGTAPPGRLEPSRDADGTVRVALHGEVDLHVVADARELLAAVRRGDSVVIDASDLSFIDSSGIAFLLKLLSRSGRTSIPVLDAPTMLREVVDVMEVGHLLELRPAPDA